MYFDVFKSIVRLVNFFCAASRNTKCASVSVIEKVNEKLNESNREDALFDLLKVNDNEVRIAVANCLNNVPLDQLSSDEMKRITSLISTYKKSSGAETQLLAKLIWIASKLVKDQEEKVGKEFRRAYAKTTIKEVVDILLDNRIAKADEDDRKYEEMLMLSCVHYLQCASMTSDLSGKIAAYSEYFCIILKEDEAVHRAMPDTPHLEVERTGMGSTVRNILVPFTSAGVLIPYSDTCLRVMQNLGRILSGSNEYDPPSVFEDEIPGGYNKSIDSIQLIKDDLIRREKQNRESEESVWDEGKIIGRMDELSEADRKELHKNVATFVGCFMLDILLNYLLGKGANTADPELTKYIEGFSDERLQGLGLLDATRELVRKEREKYIAHKVEKKMGKAKQEKEGRGEKDDLSTEDRIIRELEKERLTDSDRFIDFTFRRGLSISLQERTILKDCLVAPVIKREKDAVYLYKSMEQRALVASALMGCIYRAYTCGEEFRTPLIDQLRSRKTLLALTQLCFSTDWLYANVGAKYLILCRLILNIGNDNGYADVNLVALDEIACAATCAMIDLIDTRLKNERKVPFTERDNVLVVQISCFAVFILRQVRYLRYSSLDDSPELSSEAAKVLGRSFDNEKYLHYFRLTRPVKRHGVAQPVPPQYQCIEFCARTMLPYSAIRQMVTFLFYFNRKINKMR